MNAHEYRGGVPIQVPSEKGSQDQEKGKQQDLRPYERLFCRSCNITFHGSVGLHIYNHSPQFYRIIGDKIEGLDIITNFEQNATLTTYEGLLQGKEGYPEHDPWN